MHVRTASRTATKSCSAQMLLGRLADVLDAQNQRGGIFSNLAPPGRTAAIGRRLPRPRRIRRWPPGQSRCDPGSGYRPYRADTRPRSGHQSLLWPLPFFRSWRAGVRSLDFPRSTWPCSRFLAMFMSPVVWFRSTCPGGPASVGHRAALQVVPAAPSLPLRRLRLPSCRWAHSPCSLSLRSGNYRSPCPHRCSWSLLLGQNHPTAASDRQHCWERYLVILRIGCCGRQRAFTCLRWRCPASLCRRHEGEAA